MGVLLGARWNPQGGITNQLSHRCQNTLWLVDLPCFWPIRWRTSQVSFLQCVVLAVLLGGEAMTPSQGSALSHQRCSCWFYSWCTSSADRHPAGWIYGQGALLYPASQLHNTYTHLHTLKQHLHTLTHTYTTLTHTHNTYTHLHNTYTHLHTLTHTYTHLHNTYTTSLHYVHLNGAATASL